MSTSDGLVQLPGMASAFLLLALLPLLPAAGDMSVSTNHNVLQVRFDDQLQSVQARVDSIIAATDVKWSAPVAREYGPSGILGKITSRLALPMRTPTSAGGGAPPARTTLCSVKPTSVRAELLVSPLHLAGGVYVVRLGDLGVGSGAGGGENTAKKEDADDKVGDDEVDEDELSEPKQSDDVCTGWVRRSACLAHSSNGRWERTKAGSRNRGMFAGFNFRRLQQRHRPQGGGSLPPDMGRFSGEPTTEVALAAAGGLRRLEVAAGEQRLVMSTCVLAYSDRMRIRAHTAAGDQGPRAMAAFSGPGVVLIETAASWSRGGVGGNGILRRRRRREREARASRLWVGVGRFVVFQVVAPVLLRAAAAVAILLVVQVLQCVLLGESLRQAPEKVRALVLALMGVARKFMQWSVLAAKQEWAAGDHLPQPQDPTSGQRALPP